MNKNFKFNIEKKKEFIYLDDPTPEGRIEQATIIENIISTYNNKQCVTKLGSMSWRRWIVIDINGEAQVFNHDIFVDTHKRNMWTPATIWILKHNNKLL